MTHTVELNDLAYEALRDANEDVNGDDFDASETILSLVGTHRFIESGVVRRRPVDMCSDPTDGFVVV